MTHPHFGLGLFEEAPYDPSVPPGSRPTPAPGHAPGTGFSEPVSHGYYAGTTESAPFTASSAFGPAYQDGFPMQPNPMLNTNMWNSTRPSPPNQFYGYRLSTCTPPTDWQASNMPSLSGSHSLVAARAAALGPVPPILRSSPGLSPAFDPIAICLEAPAAPRQPHSQTASQSTPGRRAFFWQQFQRLRGSVPQGIESCWRCKSDHKKCDFGTPCRRCAALPSSGNSSIPCRRGRVCDAAAEIPFLCHMPQAAPHLLVESLPFDLQPAANLLSQTRQRRRQTASQLKGREPVAGSKYYIFCRVVNTEVPNIRTFNHPLAEMQLITPVVLPYDELIAKIVWELEDNPKAARLTGVGSVEDLVALLEAACLCEAQFGHHNPERRLVYSSIHCLLYSMEALRLSAHGQLAVDAHAGCHQANKCISPAFHGLTRYALRYAEALTMTLFHKHRGKRDDWLLAFYSLCLQGHVRHALISLEEHLQSTERSASGMEVEGFSRPLCSATYLQTAVSLFGQISMQNRGKLAERILASQPKPSVYLEQLAYSSGPGGGGGSSWQQWREEGIPEFLRRIFQIPINDSTIHYHPHHPESPSIGTDSDSDATITSSPAPAPPAMVTATVTAAITPTATTQAVNGVGGNADGDCLTIPSPGNTPEPSIIDSIWSETTCEENSDALNFDAGSLAPSSASYAGYRTPSMYSLSIVTLDDDTVEDPFWG